MAGRQHRTNGFVVASDPTQARLDQAIALHQAGQTAKAIPLYERVLLSKPRSFDALHMLGVCWLQQGKLDKALPLLEAALRVNPGSAEAHNHLGLVRQNANQPVEAIQSFQRALQIDSLHVDSLLNLGVLLLDLNMPQGALQCLELAAALRPDHGEALHQYGNALLACGKASDALGAFDKTLQVQPDHAQCWFHRGQLLHDAGQLAEAASSHQRAVELDPQLPFGLGGLLGVRTQMCDWQDLAQWLAALRAQVEAGNPAAHALTALALLDDPALHRKVAGHAAPANVAAQLPATARQPGQRLRIGYYSADFHNHATAWLMAETFERHDRSRVELFAFSFGPQTNDAMQQRLRAAFDHFIDVRDLPDADIAMQSRQLGIDIAVDLKGYTQSARPGIFAARSAPVQVNYLGYPGTMGTPCIDYLVADAVVVPPDLVGHYSEKLAWLPGCYQPNDSRRRASDRQFTRRELGLPESGFVFCCFNNSFKILPEVFTRWMDLLRQVPGSVLWLLADNTLAAANQQAEAARQGIDPQRLVFAQRMALPDHLARHTHADLVLDTSPYGAHTTASDALWMGVPVLTCPGRSFASRVAASLLTQIQLPQLIAADASAYDATALRLAREPAELAALREHLLQARGSSSLWDGGRTAAELEAAYEAMMARHAAGLPPQHLQVRA